MPLQAGGDSAPAEPKLKGILKKSSSTQDVTAGLDGYVGSNNNSSGGRMLLDVAPLASTSSISSNNSSSAEDGPNS